MRLIDDHEVEVRHRRHAVALLIDDAPHEALHRGHLHARLRRQRRRIRQPLHIVEAGQGLQLRQAHLTKGILRLLAEHRAVDEKEDAAEAPRAQETVDERKHRARLARARGHREQDGALARQHGLFRRLHGCDLIGAQVQPRGIRQLIAGSRCELLVRLSRVMGQQLQHALRRNPAVQRLGQIQRIAQILKPDAGFFLVLRQIGTAIRGEDKGHGILLLLPVPQRIGRVLLTDLTRVVTRLAIEYRRHILMPRLGLDDADHALAAEQHIVHGAALRRPLGNRHVAALLRTRAAGIADGRAVRQPADAAQLLVDAQARLGLRAMAMTGRHIGLLAPLLARGGHGMRRVCRPRRHLGIMLLLGLFLRRRLPLAQGRCPLCHRIRQGLGQHEVAVLVAIVAIRLVEPLRQRIGHGQQGTRVLCRIVVLMHGEVALLAQDMQDVLDICVDILFMPQAADTMHRIIRHGPRNVIRIIDEIDDSFAQHAQLHQAGIRIHLPILLRLPAELRQHGESFRQKGKIRRMGHRAPPPFALLIVY